MKVLLLGEYSNVHATLARGLRTLGHEVTVASDGDGWKDYARDVDLKREGGLSFLLSLLLKFRKFRGYDVVQVINPVFLPLKAERIWPFYRYLRRHNKKVFMGAFGMDHYYVRACMDCNTFRYSDFNFGPELRTTPEGEIWKRDWLHGAKGRLNRRIAEDCDGIVAGLYEYWASYEKEETLRDKLTFIPFPIEVQAPLPSPQGGKPQIPLNGRDVVSPLGGTGGGPWPELEPISFFIGIQRGKSAYKGTDVMLRALERVARELPERCRVVKVESVPFEEYRKLFASSDVILDQLYSYTPAMNALEAMAQGMVVVGGGEPENYAILDEEELRPIINVLPNEEDVYEKLRDLALHPERLPELKRQSVEYIRRHHDCVKVARQYLSFWESTDYTD